MGRAVILREHFFAPGVIAVDVAMAKVHVALVWLQAAIVLVSGGNRIPGGKAPGDDHALRIAQRLQKRFRDFGIKVIGGEAFASDCDLNRIALLH